MIRIDEYFETVKFSFYGPLALLNNALLNSLAKCVISPIGIINVIKTLLELHLNDKYYLHVSI